MELEDLQKLYPGAIPKISMPKMKEATLDKKLAYLYKVLKSIRDSWTKSQQGIPKFIYDASGNTENTNVKQLVDAVLATLDGVILVVKDIMDEGELKGGDFTNDSNKTRELARIEGTQTSSSLNEKGNGDKTGIPNAPLPSTTPSKGSKQSVTPPPPHVPLKRGPGPPPPPPLGGGKLSMNRKGGNSTKLKRSTQMSTLFQELKGKMEGTSSLLKSSNGTKKRQIGASAGGKEAMADTVVELTKRSSYFRQIEEDVQKHGKTIMELKVAINSFKSKDMVMLVKFQKNVDSFLDVLTDETQALSKFEDFPTKKLEVLRAVAALYSKLDLIVINLKNWQIEPPLGQLLDKVDCYFSKIKVELDALDRVKDEESKKFKSQNIDFDFNILTLIKELMVNVSSNCLELALKERREAKMGNEKSDSKTKGLSVKLLWRAFQLAFRIYSFAGGQDERADKLTKELAHQIVADSSNT